MFRRAGVERCFKETAAAGETQASLIQMGNCFLQLSQTVDLHFSKSGTENVSLFISLSLLVNAKRGLWFTASFPCTLTGSCWFLPVGPVEEKKTSWERERDNRAFLEERRNK